MFTVLTNPSFKQVLLGMMRLTLKARFAMVTGLLVLVWLAGCCCLVLFFGLGPCCLAFCRHLLCCQITAFPRWILSDPPLALYTNLRILVMKHHTHTFYLFVHGLQYPSRSVAAEDLRKKMLGMMRVHQFKPWRWLELDPCGVFMTY